MERPILFSTPMVQAISDLRKNQTRRTRGLEKLNDYYFQSLVLHSSGKYTFCPNGNYNPSPSDIVEVKCPYGEVGDILWVRETYKHECGAYRYKASPNVFMKTQNIGPSITFPWKPSIQMPKSAARIFLQITDISVERLNDISEEDSKLEGIKEVPVYSLTYWTDYMNIEDGLASTKSSFKSLWESINGSGSWDSNPWVWVLKFKQISK
jgi:hypothetical protein